MTDVPEVRWARSEAGNLAYERFGAGDVELVMVIGATSHLQLHWGIPGVVDLLRGLGSLAQVTIYDERGMGVSDPVPDDRPPTLEERVDDLMAVIDAAGIERATLWGHTDGAAVALLASVTHPDRIDSVVVAEGYARLSRSDDHPIGAPSDSLERYLEWVEQVFFDDDAARALAHFTCPSIEGDEELTRGYISLVRQAASPAQTVNRFALFSRTDVRDILPVVSKPTLIVHQRHDRMIPVAHGRHLADHVPGVKYVELPGRDHSPFYENREPLLRETANFLRGAGRTESQRGRMLATVLFTDIVDSTAMAAELGDREWRSRLEQHDRIANRWIDEYRGTLVKTTGDGVLATFDGPSRAVSCADDIRRAVRELGIEVRAGVHTGEIESRGDDVAGMAVHVASRIMSLAEPGEIRVSSTVRDLAVGAGIEFDDLGTHALKGVPDEWHVLSVKEDKVA